MKLKKGLFPVITTSCKILPASAEYSAVPLLPKAYPSEELKKKTSFNMGEILSPITPHVLPLSFVFKLELLLF